MNRDKVIRIDDFREPQMSEQMRRDMDAKKRGSFLATMTTIPPFGLAPEEIPGICWKCADFDKKDSEDYHMWLFEPDDGSGDVHYRHEKDLNIGNALWPAAAPDHDDEVTAMEDFRRERDIGRDR